MGSLVLGGLLCGDFAGRGLFLVEATVRNPAAETIRYFALYALPRQPRTPSVSCTLKHGSPNYLWLGGRYAETLTSSTR
jgi:hypothetical protein